MSQRFQNVLLKKEDNVNHAIIGGIVGSCPGFSTLSKTDKKTMMVLTDLVIAHHSEIIKSLNLKDPPSSWDDLIFDKKYSVSSNEEFKNICLYYLNKIKNKDISELNCTIDDECFEGALEKMLFVRMLFSCLVDADYSSSAMFFNSKYLEENSKTIGSDISILIQSLADYRQSLIKNSNASTSINQLRAYVYEQCNNASEKLPGLYTLTAPTGTAKTLAMLNFALKHAKKYNKKRIFVVLPFLSIIDQQVNTMNQIFGSGYVLEDDSQVENNANDAELVNRWSGMIVVPTMVKMLETLFENSACALRKLHNLNDSIILIDEFQSIPTHLLNATISTFKELANRYGCTVLFASATPPNLSNRKGLEWWDKETTEIIQDVNWLYSTYNQTKKLEVNWNINQAIFEQELICSIEQDNNVGCILNTKSAAERIYNGLTNKQNAFLISTNLCSAHRKDNIDEIKKLQNLGNPVRVISTQCIEAGVDISFERMYRELGPLEAIVQAAGRCNRNANSVGKMDVILLNGAKDPDVHYYNAKQNTKFVLKQLGIIDITDLSCLERYYRRLYNISGYDNDSSLLLEAISKEDFQLVNKYYNVIEEREQFRIIVPYKKQYNKYESFIKEFNDNNGIVTMKQVKSVQMLTVSTFNKDFRKYCKPVLIKTKHNPEGVPSNFYVLMENTIGVEYNNEIGLKFTENNLIF